MMYARLFKFLILPGRGEAYAHYLRDVVTPIDEAAHRDGVFEQLHTLLPDQPADWNHGRVFLFRSYEQRDAFSEAIAGQAALFDGSKDATLKRKAHAEDLRRLVDVVDLQIA